MKNMKTNINLDNINTLNANEINYATLKLFKVVLIKNSGNDLSVNKNANKYIRKGIVFSNELSNGILGNIIRIENTADLLYGVDLMKMNSTFHKSFGTVNDMSAKMLHIQQILHYVTTYGAESNDTYNSSLVYVPAEELDLPGEIPVKFTVIHGITINELLDRLDNLLTSGIALSEETLTNIMTLINALNIEVDIETVKNKEAAILLYKEYNKVPKNPVDFLRYIIYTITDSSLLINNKDTINRLRASSNATNELFKAYIRDNDLPMNKLASIFYRYKNLWLAMKNNENAHIINKMRRLAPTCHKPVKKGVLDRITSECVDIDEVKSELNKITTFKKVSLFNALSYRLSSPDSIVYKIRNGKSFAKPYTKKCGIDVNVYDTVLKSIVDDVKNNIKGKYFVIPNNVTYAVPTSEKMFIGNMPVNSSISLSDRAVVGVHWENTEDDRVDLDLHSYNLTANFGWNAAYRDKGKIVFTGDMTDAQKPDGATEAVYMSDEVKEYALMFKLNDYTDIANRNDPLDYKLIIDAPDVDLLDKNYIIDNATMMVSINQKLECTEDTLGLLVSDAMAHKTFYFMKMKSDGNVYGKITDKDKQIFSYAMTSTKTVMGLSNLIKLAGGIIVNSIDDIPANDKSSEIINLSLENINKDTIINIIAKN